MERQSKAPVTREKKINLAKTITLFIFGFGQKNCCGEIETEEGVLFG